MGEAKARRSDWHDARMRRRWSQGRRSSVSKARSVAMSCVCVCVRGRRLVGEDGIGDGSAKATDAPGRHKSCGSAVPTATGRRGPASGPAVLRLATTVWGDMTVNLRAAVMSGDGVVPRLVVVELIRMYPGGYLLQSCLGWLWKARFCGDLPMRKGRTSLRSTTTFHQTSFLMLQISDFRLGAAPDPVIHGVLLPVRRVAQHLSLDRQSLLPLRLRCDGP